MGDNPPNAKQWDRIKEMVEKIDGKPVTEIVYREWYYGRPWYYNQPYYGSIGSGGLVLNGYNGAAVADNQATWKAEGDSGFNMYYAGKAEALEAS